MLIWGTRYSESPSDAHVAVERSPAPSGNQSRLWPGGQPGVDEGVGGGAVGKDTVYAEVVSQATVGAWA